MEDGGGGTGDKSR